MIDDRAVDLWGPLIRADLGDTPVLTDLLEALGARPGWDWLKSTGSPAS